MTKKICLINCFFGECWPKYFDFFLDSCKNNKDVDFLIISNLPAPQNLKNVEFLLLENLEHFNQIATNRLKIPINLIDNYKLCDLKPAYGAIFKDHLKNYDFWGYCDIDVVFGNIKSFITDEILEDNDIISIRKEYPCGFFTIYRNVVHINEIFKTSKDYPKVFLDRRHYCFDECNFRFEELSKEGADILNVPSEIDSIGKLISVLSMRDEIRFFKTDLAREFQKEKEHYYYKSGNLYDCKTQSPILLVHLINIKFSRFFLIDKYVDECPFYISRKGITRFRKNYINGSLDYSHALIKKWYDLSRFYYDFFLLLLRYSNAQIVNELQNKCFGVGKLSVSFLISGNEISVLIRDGIIKSVEQGRILQKNENSFLCLLGRKPFYVKVFYDKSECYKFQFKNLLTNRVITGYHIKK